MVSMYPHRLYLVSVSSSRDADGYIASTEGEETFLGHCRLETQGRASEMVREDGKQAYVSATIYASSLSGALTSGNLVSVRDSNGGELMRKPVINVSRTQLHTRIWV